MSTAWVSIKGSPIKIRRSFHDFKDKAKTLVRNTKTEIYLEVPDSELGWVDKVVKDLGLTALTVATAPSYKTAPCGVFTADLVHHVARCKACAAAGGLGRIKRDHKTPKAGRVIHVAKVPGLTELDLKSMLAVMKQRMDECLTLAQSYDSAIKAIEGMATVEARLSEIQKEKVEHVKALEMFLK
jgi:hypothetical protein